ncbi:RNA polymerase II C-terminal domain kinase beta subunit [Allomyces javanicus]|nr:RNA polymerase II C-terminal domain kinase beta subunit [Allomyces javanicus]
MAPLSSADRQALAVCTLIRDFGRALGFPLTTLAAAQFLFHLTAARERNRAVPGLREGPPIDRAPSMDAALACLLVAGKVHNTAKKLRDLMVRAYAWTHPGASDVNPEGERCQRWRLRIILLERQVLEAMQFSFTLPLPFDLLIKIAKKTACTKTLTFHAWTLLFDLFQHRVVTTVPPLHLTFAALYLTARTRHAGESATPVEEEREDGEAPSDDDDDPTTDLWAWKSCGLPSPAVRLLKTQTTDLLPACHAVLEYLIAATRTDDPLFEAYRTVKIDLNEIQGSTAGPTNGAPTTTAVLSPPPPPPPVHDTYAAPTVVAPPSPYAPYAASSPAPPVLRASAPTRRPRHAADEMDGPWPKRARVETRY